MIKGIVWALFCMLMAVGLFACGTSGTANDGGSGTNNKSVATTVRNTAPTSTCPNGGISVDSGIDTNGNSVLDTSEVKNTQYVCNGANGTDGTSGTNGTNGLNALVVVTNEPTGTNCANGGKKVSVGVDTSGNSSLESLELTSNAYICNGAAGSAGQNGTNGHNTLMSISSEPVGTNCSSGGIKITNGLDLNDNGTLASAEVTATNYICGDEMAPTAPNLTASAINDCKVNLSWTSASDNVAVHGYDVWRDHVKIATTDNVTTTFTDTDLICAATYSYKVDAYDSAGNISSYSNIASALTATTINIFSESFETSTVGSAPNGWTVMYSGNQIAASSAKASDGTKSLYMQGVPYGGADIYKDISGLNITTGVYNLTFYMNIDSANFGGTDGETTVQLHMASKVASFDIGKVSGVYKALLYGATSQTVSFTAATDAWVKYEIVMNLTSNTADFYINGSKVGSDSLGTSSSTYILLGAGNAGPGGGTPAAYFDNISLQQL